MSDTSASDLRSCKLTPSLIHLHESIPDWQSKLKTLVVKVSIKYSSSSDDTI